MTKLVREHVAEHEPPQGTGRPGHNAFLAEIGARSLELCSLLRGRRISEPPRRRGLVVQHNSPRSDKLTEDQPASSGRDAAELHRLDAVVDLRTENLQRVPHVGYRRRMVPPGGRAPSAHDGEARPSGSANATRIAAEAVGHERMLTTPREARALEWSLRAGGVTSNCRPRRS